MFYQVNVECFSDKNLCFKQILESSPNDTVGTFISKLLESRHTNAVIIRQVYASEKNDSAQRVEIQLDTPITTLSDFGKKYLSVQVSPTPNSDTDGAEDKNKEHAQSAFDVLMNSARAYDQLPEPM